LSDFSKDCTDCGACVDACPFMKEYGTPRKIAEEKPERFLLHILPSLRGVVSVGSFTGGIFLRSKRKTDS